MEILNYWAEAASPEYAAKILAGVQAIILNGRGSKIDTVRDYSDNSGPVNFEFHAPVEGHPMTRFVMTEVLESLQDLTIRYGTASISGALWGQGLDVCHFSLFLSLGTSILSRTNPSVRPLPSQNHTGIAAPIDAEHTQLSQWPDLPFSYHMGYGLDIWTTNCWPQNPDTEHRNQILAGIATIRAKLRSSPVTAQNPYHATSGPVAFHFRPITVENFGQGILAELVTGVEALWSQYGTATIFMRLVNHQDVQLASSSVIIAYGEVQ